MTTLVLLLSLANLATSPPGIQIFARKSELAERNGKVAAAPAISPNSSTVFLIYKGDTRAPLIKTFPNWRTRDGEDAREAIQSLAGWREDSQLYPGMETDETNPGLGAVLNAIEFRPAEDGTMEAVFYGEYNGVRAPVDQNLLAQLNAGKTVSLNFDSIVSQYIYEVRTSFVMTVKLDGRDLSIQKTTAKMGFTYKPITSFIGGDVEVYESQDIEVPALIGKRAADDSAVKDLNLLN